ncbi:MAG: ABC transporter permease [Desulfobacter sp.]|nr:ABC transporter permease [Desulfobacter sp.]
MHLLLSWRNIWRNPKRTLIILLAVIVGAWSMLAFSALSRGIMASVLSNALNTLTGHIQVQAEKYRDDPVVENRINTPGPLKNILDNHLPKGSVWGFRIQVGGVASNARNAQSITIVGIEPKKEASLSFYADMMTQGDILTPGDDKEIIVGKALADTFETKLGRKILLMSQGTDQETASRAFRIKGIFKAELEATEKQFVFISLSAAQKMLKMNTAVTNAAVKLPDLELVGPVAQTLSDQLPRDMSVLTWQQLLPLVKGYISMFDSFMLLWYVVGFLAMAFGLVNTMLMAVLERTREFGLLKALGMKPARIIINVLLECLFLLIMGLLAGNLLGAATVSALSGGIDLSFLAQGSEFFGMGNRVFPFLIARDIISVNLVILVLGLLVCLYPAVKAGCITPKDAMAKA